MPAFNPNSTNIAGLEWYPTRQLPRPLKQGAGIGVLLPSTVSESIELVVPWLSSPNNALVGVDVYDAGAIGGPVVGGIELPSIDVAISAGFEQTPDGGTTWNPYSAGHTRVNKAVPDIYSPADLVAMMSLFPNFIRYKPTGSQGEGHLTWQTNNTYFKATDGTSGNSPVGKRVASVEVHVLARAETGRSAKIDSVLRFGAASYGSDDGPKRVGSHWQLLKFKYLWNPQSGTQWYESDIADFNSGGPNSFGISVTGKAGIEWWVGAVNIVWRSLTENRVATGYLNSGVNGFAGITLLDPTNGSLSAWAKSSGLTYLMLFYLTGQGGNCSLNGVDQASLAENPGGALGGWLGADQPSVPGTAVPSGAYSTSTWAPSILLSAAGPAESVDSQPYVQPRIMRVHTADALGDNAEKINGHATADYALAQFVVGLFDENGTVIRPDGSLTVQIVDNGFAPVGGQILLGPDEVPADGRWHLINRRLDSAAALASGSTYYLAFSTTSNVPWSVAYVDIIDPAAVGGAGVGAGGIVNTVTGTTDLLSNVGTVPPPLTGFAGVVNAVATPGPPGGPTMFSFVSLTWDPSSLGGAFGRYEVQRGGEVIALITDETLSSFPVYDARRNAAEDYRVRVVRADGAQSDWSADLEFFVPTDAKCDLVIVDPVGNLLGYQELGDNTPVHSTSRANAQSTVVHLIAGRQAPVAFRPAIEGNADVFTRTIIVQMDTAGIPVGADSMDRWAFLPLIDMIESSTSPYLVLCDGHGYRWYVFIEFVDGSYAWQGHEHQVTLKFTEVAITAIPLVVSNT